MFTVSLLEPKIPQNTGNIARLCGATNTRLDIVGEIGFKMTDKYVKRAGLDYWDHIDHHYISDIDQYIHQLNPKKIHLLTTKSNVSYTERAFEPDDIIIFGSETQGINEDYLRRFEDRCCTIPMPSPNIRSLNLSNSVAIVLYEALRQNNALQTPEHQKNLKI